VHFLAILIKMHLSVIKNPALLQTLLKQSFLCFKKRKISQSIIKGDKKKVYFCKVIIFFLRNIYVFIWITTDTYSDRVYLILVSQVSRPFALELNLLIDIIN